MGEDIFRSYISVPEKARYSRGLDRPKVDCLLCAMVRKDAHVEAKILFEESENMIVLNKFPYNSGHLLVFPKKHVEKLWELDDRSLTSFFRLIKKSSTLIERTYAPEGMNIGINQGRAAGASVAHLHVHLVPRYSSETGFMEVLAGSRVIHETLDDTLKRFSANIDLLK